MKRMTKFEMAMAIREIDAWNPMVIYWDKGGG